MAENRDFSHDGPPGTVGQSEARLPSREFMIKQF